MDDLGWAGLSWAPLCAAICSWCGNLAVCLGLEPGAAGDLGLLSWALVGMQALLTAMLIPHRKCTALATATGPCVPALHALLLPAGVPGGRAASGVLASLLMTSRLPAMIGMTMSSTWLLD